MKYIKQFTIIILVSFAGEVLRAVIPLPVPAGIYGLVLMFLGLVTKIIPYEDVKDTGNYLVTIMPVIFIAPSVRLMESMDILKPVLVPYLVITFVSLFGVMLAAGRVTQFILRRGKKE